MSQNNPVNIEALFAETERCVAVANCRRTPIIGISTNQKEDTSRVANAYVRSIVNAGGIPLLIPECEDFSSLSEILERIDGLLLTGGGDISPELLGEKPLKEVEGVNVIRDCAEIALVRMAMQRQMPLLGICRGHQIINVACGGDNYQDIAKQHQGTVLKHSQDEPRNVASHLVSVKKGTLLANIIGECDLPTNSFHHQGVSVVAPGFIGSAETSDGVNEAIEKPSYPVMGVQWHPEAMASVGDERMLSLFRWLVEGSAVYRRAREFHRRELTLDSHCDTPMFFPERVNIGVRDLRLKVDIPKLIDGRIDAECMVAYLPQRGRSDAELAAATEKCNSILEELRCQIALNSSRVIQVRNEKEILAAKRAGKKGIFFGIENGYAIGRDISALKHYRDEGIIYMTLCHNGDNDICDSAKGEREHGGLSEFGRYVVKEMNEIGMMVDISHASDESFYDALKLSTAPIIASHSSCRALCGHRRNLTDEQIKALADCGGVVQICIYEDFLSDDGLATVKTVADHINHVVELVGVDYVGIGSDLDGGGGVPGCNAVNELINITCELIRRGYGDGDLKKIWGGNFLRVMGVVNELSN